MSSIRPFGTQAKLLRAPCVKHEKPILTDVQREKAIISS